MTQLNVILLGAPGAGKGTQAERIVARLRPAAHLHRRDAARRRRRGHRAGPRGAEVHGGRRPGPRRGRDRRSCASGWPSPTPAEGFLLDGFPRTLAAGGGARRHARRGRAGDDARASLIDVPDEELVQRLAGRRTCRHCGKGYHVVFDPPKADGVCDVCGGELYQRSRRQRGDGAQPARRVPRADGAADRLLRAARGVAPERVSAAASGRTRSSSDVERRPRRRPTRRDRPQVGRQRSPRSPPRARSSRTASTCSSAAVARPASPRLSSTAGREVHPRARRRADVPRLPRLPGVDLRFAQRHGRARHPGQVPGAPRATCSASTSA